MTYIIMLAVSYLLGAIPFGLLLARWAGKGDIRRVGSGGTGATNVMRVGGFKLAAATWILDMTKSMMAVWIGYLVGGENFAALCGLFSVVGHCFPVWLKFKGGKGISCMFGTMLAINPLLFIICAIEWLIVSLYTGYSSLSAIVAFTILPILGFAMSDSIGWIFVGITLICIYCHRENIMRLIRGTESKIEWRWKK